MPPAFSACATPLSAYTARAASSRRGLDQDQSPGRSSRPRGAASSALAAATARAGSSPAARAGHDLGPEARRRPAAAQPPRPRRSLRAAHRVGRSPHVARIAKDGNVPATVRTSQRVPASGLPCRGLAATTKPAPPARRASTGLACRYHRGCAPDGGIHADLCAPASIYSASATPEAKPSRRATAAPRRRCRVGARQRKANHHRNVPTAKRTIEPRAPAGVTPACARRRGGAVEENPSLRG